MSPKPADRFAGYISFPRVSGDEPPAYSDAKINEVFSPRERG